MKVVFVHDHKFRRVDGTVYSPGGLPNDILTRYVDIFGSVTVIGRIIDEKHVKLRYSRISDPNIMVKTNVTLKKDIHAADAVIIRLPSLNGYKAIYYAKKYDKPYLVEVVGCTWDAYWNYGIKGKVLAAPAYLSMKYFVLGAPFALYVTKEFLQRRYPCNGKQIGVSDVELQPADISVLQNRLKRINKRDEKSIVLGTASAIDVPYKGQQNVIKALWLINKRLGINAEYQLIGAGNQSSLKHYAKKLGVEDKVIFKGTIPHSEVFDWLDQIDVYIQPSMLEGLSRALLEAMSRGLPCIATKCGGNPELIDGKYLFEKWGKMCIPTRIFYCLEQMLAPGEMEKQANRNFQVVAEEYRKEYLDSKREQFYKSFNDIVNN